MNRLQFHFVIAAAAACALLPLSVLAQAPAPMKTKTPSTTATVVAVPTLAVISTTATVTSATAMPTSALTSTSVLTPTTCVDGGAWAGYFGAGVSCLDGVGWQLFDEKSKSIASDQVSDVEQCGEKIVVAHTFGISTRIKGRWRTDRLRATAGSAAAVDCDVQGNVWVAHYDGVSVFDGKSFRTIESRRLGSGSGAKVVQDVAVGPDGKVWVVTANSVARYDGATWKVWEQGAGFTRQEFFGHVAVDSHGRPWVTAVGGLYIFDDGAWMRIEQPDMISVEGIFIDAADRVLVASTDHGVYVYEDNAWINYSRENSAISSDHVHAAVVDARGRIWIATAFGLDVVQGDEWRHYRVSNSGLQDNDVRVLDVEGAGPLLPLTAMQEITGTLAGRVMNADAPEAGVTIELCVEYVGGSFRGASPCAEQPYSRTAVTNQAGRYTFADLPAGDYYVVFRKPGGGWVRLMAADGFAPERVRVDGGRGAGDVNIDMAKAK